MPLSKVIDTQKGNRVYSNQEWYHQHLLHGCWKLTCPYVAVNYHPSMYEPQVHPDYKLCTGLLRGPSSNDQSPAEIRKWIWSYSQRRPVEQSVQPVNLNLDLVTKRQDRFNIILPEFTPKWLPSLQSMYDYQRLVCEKRKDLRTAGLLPDLAGIAIIQNERLFQDGIELTGVQPEVKRGRGLDFGDIIVV